MIKTRFVVLASLATLALARPEAGYSYSSPAPSGGGYSSGSTGLSFGGSSGYASGSSGYSSGPIISGYSSGPASSGYSSAPISSGYSSGGSSGGYSSGSSSSYSGGYNYAPAAPVVQKHIYVHVPPPEQEYIAPQQIQQIAPPQKHYKIIFIKAPTPPTPTAPIIPQIQQDSEKTLIYVLVKRPEDQPQISIPTPAPTTPSKPEVYFIKYKTQKESGYGASSGSSYNSGSSSDSIGHAGISLSSLPSSGPGSSYSSPSSSYGSPSASPSSSYGAPSSSGSY